MGGYNGTVFSYGQTGSGKTHTMMGNDDEPGIIPQAIQAIFEHIREDPNREFLLRISYLEIYNESLRDLLSPNTNQSREKELKLIEDKKGRIVVTNLKEEIVSSPIGVFDCLMKGEENRSVAGTDWNLRSSRSHCVFSMVSFHHFRKMAVIDLTNDPPRSSSPVPGRRPSPANPAPTPQFSPPRFRSMERSGSRNSTSSISPGPNGLLPRRSAGRREHSSTRVCCSSGRSSPNWRTGHRAISPIGTVN